MKSNVNVVDHPLHPILVLIPAGAWITSLVLDIILLATGDTFWFVASFWVMIIGIAGALLAAIAGFIDLFGLPMTDEPKGVGLTHMALNLVIVVLYIINAAAIRAPALTSATTSSALSSATLGWGFVLNVIAVILLVISGWLGGELIYRYGIAVPRETIEHAPSYEARPAYGGTAEAGSLGGESDEDTR
jgi:uncharacterized membrane protein